MDSNPPWLHAHWIVIHDEKQITLNPKKVAEIFNEHAEVYAQRFENVSAYFPIIDQFTKQLPSLPRLIDLGSGPGNMAKVILERTKVSDYWCIDLAENMLSIAKTIDPVIQTLHLDSLSVPILQQHLNSLPIHGVVCSFCAPYWSNEELEHWLSEIPTLLTNDALLYFSTMGNKYEHSGIKTNSYGQKLWMNYYDLDYLSEQFKRAGWKTIQQEIIDDGNQTHEFIAILQR